MRQETFKVSTNMRLENSFGVIGSNIGAEVEVTVGIHEEGETGWFEFYDINSEDEEWHAEGGLWFSNNTLTDYDGVSDIPVFVLDKLKEWGYTIEDHMYE